MNELKLSNASVFVAGRWDVAVPPAEKKLADLARASNTKSTPFLYYLFTSELRHLPISCAHEM
jgi:hypothetical protein